MEILALESGVSGPLGGMTGITCLPTAPGTRVEPRPNPNLAEIRHFSPDEFSFCPLVLQKSAVRYFWPTCADASAESHGGRTERAGTGVTRACPGGGHSESSDHHRGGLLRRRGGVAQSAEAEPDPKYISRISWGLHVVHP